MKTNGFDKLGKRLEQMQKGAKDLEATEEVSFEVLFNESFMRKYTNVPDIKTFISESPFEILNQEDFEKIDKNVWDQYVKDQSRFSNWQAMQEEAGKEYIAKKLGFR
ncbi:hypothetical protein [Domibacillus enclensis]|uniref:Uncharacterized protein n=1 Tax=Domibacillus enclensis TaxID=1017273 RepID=A0A1N6WIK0_9BACI|nr:hypothetical protein [Domibacillus enclensis]OXS77944.1 hypothetical protein B1B05_10080 [Domibacillus enclensis]SIQ89848.1 hypothetical protein SAMN05443094_104177 [Domibacillus enclensis]